MWVATGLQRLIAAQELAHVAQQAEADLAADANKGAARGFLAAYRHGVGLDMATSRHPSATNPGTASAGQPGANGKGNYPAVPAEHVREVLNSCQVSSERLNRELGSPMMNQTLTRAAAVMVNMMRTVTALPTFLRPILSGANTVSVLAYRATAAGPGARYPLLIGLGLIAVGAMASTSTIAVISAAGLIGVLTGLLLIAVGATRRISLVASVVALAAGVALIAAGFVPVIRAHLFPWLKDTVVPALEKHPALWAVVVAFLLLPPVWTIVGILRRPDLFKIDR
jgi:hypothetical protein